MKVIKMLNLALKFFIEIGTVLTFAYYGTFFGKTFLSKCIYGILLPAIIIFVWGQIAAPKAKHRLPLLYRVLFGWTLFMISSFFLFLTSHLSLAIIFAVTATLCETGTVVWKQ